MHYPALLAVLFRVVARVVARVIVSVIVVGSAAGAQAAGPLSGLQLLTAEGTRAVEDVHPLGTSRWLLARHDGLVLAEANDIEPIIKGSFESIDTRESVMIAGRALTLISVIDTDAGNVRLLSFDPDARAIVASRSLDYASAIPETQCLYRDPTSDNISLFTIDARGMLEQRYVYDGYQQAVIDLTVRRDIAVPEAQACAVDDNSGSLYVAEEPLGVWRYSASEESDPLREPVLLRSPHGALAGDVEDIAVDAQGVLWTLVQNPGRIYRTVPAGNGAEEWELPAGSEMIAIAPRPTDEALLLGLHDEASGQTLLARLDDSEWGSGKQASDKVLPVTRANTPPMHRILPAAQTAAVRRFGDAADDPAIFFDPDRPEKSLILGTDKREGLAVYALDGSRRQMLPVGRVNNVDVVTEVPLGERRRNIAAASNRSNNSISLFEIHAGELRHLADLPTGLDDVYGLCMYAAGDLAWVYINATDGRYEQYRLGWGATGPTAERVRQWRLPSQPEGCVADPLTGQLYMGEEPPASGPCEPSPTRKHRNG
jgi:3-phytase